ncbi:MAG: type II toxin-antitoxin system RelE/ParE family toxin [Hyphomicrobiaceae bacterium]
MRVFATKAFRRFQRKEQIENSSLCEAILRAERGLVDADLGRGLIKQRVARKGQGRRGGFRTIVAYRAAERSVFMFGFANSRQANLSAADERDLADFGALLLGLGDAAIETMLMGDELKEVAC